MRTPREIATDVLARTALLGIGAPYAAHREIVERAIENARAEGVVATMRAPFGRRDPADTLTLLLARLGIPRSLYERKDAELLD